MKPAMDFGAYLFALCNNLADFQAVPTVVALQCTKTELILDLDTVTSLGIVAAELVTNSYEHAFPHGAGTIAVSLARDPGTDSATMTIADDGVGFVPQAHSKRHGLGLIRRLVEQVGGTVDLVSAAGTVWTIRVPAAPL